MDKTDNEELPYLFRNRKKKREIPENLMFYTTLHLKVFHPKNLQTFIR